MQKKEVKHLYQENDYITKTTEKEANKYKGTVNCNTWCNFRRTHNFIDA